MAQQSQTEASPRAPWPARVTGLLSGAACGMAVNALSDDFGYPGAAAAFGLAAVVSAVHWLRRLPTHAPLPRHTTRALLGLAFVVAVAGAVRPGWVAPAIVAATALVVVAVTLVTDVVTVFRLVGGVVVVAFGVGLAGAGAGLILRGEPVAGALIATQGVLMVPAGVLLSVVARPTRETALGLSLICFAGGAGALADSAPTGARGWQADVAVVGAAFLCGGVALLVRRPLVRGAAAVLAGGGLVALGAMTTYTGRDALFGAAIVIAGLGAAAGGIVAALPARHRRQARWAKLTGRTRAEP